MEDTSLLQLESIEALSLLNDNLSELCKKIVILIDERDEYKRKWLEAINTITIKD